MGLRCFSKDWKIFPTFRQKFPIITFLFCLLKIRSHSAEKLVEGHIVTLYTGWRSQYVKKSFVGKLFKFSVLFVIVGYNIWLFLKTTLLLEVNKIDPFSSITRWKKSYFNSRALLVNCKAQIKTCPCRGLLVVYY